MTDTAGPPPAPVAPVWRFVTSARNQGVALALAVGLAPLLLDKGFSHEVSNIVLFIEIFLLLALGLNLVVGLTGLLDLGFVVFMATGAVVTVLLSGLRSGPQGYDWPIGTDAEVTGTLVFGFEGSIFVILLITGAVCALLGVIRGIPTLRVRGDYFAIVTLGFAEIVYELNLWDASKAVNFTRVTGGAFGAKLASPDRPRLFGARLFWDTPQFYYLVLALVVVALIASRNVIESRLGRALAAVRLDETAAKACGVNVARTKLVAFALSGFIGGIGGAIYALWAGTVAVKSLDVWQSVLILCCLVLGGMGSLRGAVVGTATLMFLGEVLRQRFGGVSIPPEARYLVYGLVLIVVMRFRPQGLLPPDRRLPPFATSEQERLRRGACEMYSLGTAGPAVEEPLP